MKCFKCFFYKGICHEIKNSKQKIEVTNLGICYRNPTIGIVYYNGFCGEFKPKEQENANDKI